ncbi:MAG: PQQ-dependent dehydrogenase, methanol/ethanol family [Novosphingobium sp.]|nr:PQQ-dependent dehydrogenase, methanol/ethanol family [Novosphingobium sp.]
MRFLIAATLAILLLGGCGRGSQFGTEADWPGHGGAADESGFSRLAEIDSANIDRLGLAWSLDLPGEVTLEATPLAVDGTLYFSGSYSAVYAVDAASGKLKWRFDPEIWNHDPERMHLIFGANRGVAYGQGRIFVGALDGRLIALDAATGEKLWSADTLSDGSLQFLTGAPRVIGDKVIIGSGGGDLGSRGYVTAYNLMTGKRAWRFYTVPGSPEQNKGDAAMEMAAETWTGEYWKTGTGGTVWNGMTYDPELNRVYIGTGNSSPYNPRIRSPGGGDNLFLVSIVALDVDTGKYVWHYQMNPREAWDYKATANIIAATLEIDGKPRNVLMQAPTNGFFYVLDRETGKLLSAEKTGKVTWAEGIDLATGRPIEAPNIRYESGETTIWPSPVGTHNWQAMSFSPDTGLAYIPAMEAGATFQLVSPEADGVALGGLSIAMAKTDDPNEGTGSLQAWDPVKQSEAWKVKLPTFWNGGTLATRGGLVFQGTGDGKFTAYDAKHGKRLWQFDAGLGIIAAPISYSAGGKQYVAVLVGYGGSPGAGTKMMQGGWKYGAQKRRLLAFALDGDVSLSPSLLADFTVSPVDDPTIRIDAADVSAGSQLYLRCVNCHGMQLQSGGVAPDLRESTLAMDMDSLWSVLHDGSLQRRGMPRYEKLTRGEVRQLRAYVRSGARVALRSKGDE